MSDAVRHRGPDSGAVWCDYEAAVVFAHRRLAIVDLSPAGHQPMESHDGRFIITFNGEIYNHLDVRRQLHEVDLAPTWRGHSDTETLLAAIVAWGIEEALCRAVGMFAIAIWDRRLRTLYLSRDRLGEKPLYYGWLGDTFAFGSELKSLRQHPDWQNAIDRDALALMMRFGYVPAPFSIYRGISKLRPGCVLKLGHSAQDVEISTYWSATDVISAGRSIPFAGSAADAVDTLETLLQDVVRGQMMSDVPLGAFLSGGVDSSAVVALMQAQSSRPVKTFSIGFHETAYNEANHAKAVAAHLRTDHTELYVTAGQAMDVIPRLPELYDEPFADPSQIPTYLVAQLARAEVTVALSGDGGDELFSGYDRYRIGAGLWRSYNRIPHAARSVASAGIRSLPPGLWSNAMRFPMVLLPAHLRPQNTGHKMYRIADMMDAKDVPGMYRAMISQWSTPEQLVLRSREPAVDAADPMQVLGENNAIEGMMAIDLIRYLPDDILVKVDRASMAVSLETRVPLLDHRIVAFAWSLPQQFKVRDGKAKWVLRQVLDRYVPSNLIDRPKMGFGVPIDSWLRGPLRDWAEALLDEQRLRREGFFDAVQVRKRWNEHVSGAYDWQYPMWNVLMFQAWLAANAIGQSAARNS